MALVSVGMATSLDGFVADSRGSASSLYPDLTDLQGTDLMNEAIERTGPVVMGRRQQLRAGLVDELQVDIMPVLFGGGLRLFDGLDRPPALEKSRVREVGARTSLTFRVLHD
jgi:RibD C-terminal domain